MNHRITSTFFVLLLIGGLGLTARGYSVWTAEAFSAFYCAGAAISSGESPYTVEPLRSCEHRVWPTNQMPANVVEPAPLPGYAFLPFVLLAKIPYRAACVLFAGFLLAALVASAYILSKLSGLSIAVTLGALIVVGYINVFFGELQLLGIFFLCVTAAYVTAGRDRLAALACTAAMIEPHAALAGVVSLFIWRPRTRMTFLVAAYGCALLSAVLLNPSIALSYVTRVLPVHARSEINAADQYSLTWLAHAFGASDAVALALGTFSYVVLMIVGVYLAPRVAKALRADALIVLFPVAATTLFGSFIHDVQLPTAMPAALIIAGASLPGIRRILAFLPVFILAVSWQSWWFTRQMTLFGAVALASIAACMPCTLTPLRRGALVIMVLLAFHFAQFGITHLSNKPVFALAASAWPSLQSITADDSASLDWGTYVHAVSSLLDASPQLFIAKTIVWFALIILICSAASACGVSPPVGEYCGKRHEDEREYVDIRGLVP